MVSSYTTMQGDTFDTVARTVYGNERRMDVLIDANPRHADTIVFPAGVDLRVPELPQKQAELMAPPPWRKRA